MKTYEKQFLKNWKDYCFQFICFMIWQWIAAFDGRVFDRIFVNENENLEVETGV